MQLSFSFSKAVGRSIKAFFVVLALSITVSNAQAQEPVATPENTIKQLQVPTIAPDYRGQQKPLPELNRVGVDMAKQHPLSIREALAMALENNKDIELARENVKRYL